MIHPFHLFFSAKVTNAGRATFAQNVNVLMNSYQLDIKQMVPQVFQYELRFIGERTFTRKDNQPEKKLQDLATGPRNDVSKETRRRLLWLLFQQLITQHADFFGTEKRNFTFDCALLLFSVKPLITDKKQRKFPMDVNRVSCGYTDTIYNRAFPFGIYANFITHLT
jgi:hypothetical protein